MEGKVGIVILNYLNYKDTINCVNSCLQLNYKNLYIIIVDNHSSNASYEVLSDLFGSIQNLKVLLTKKNLGFAKGNNLGIEYCRKICKCEFVLVVNNDIIIHQKDFIKILLESYKKHYKKDDNLVAIMGPKIINKRGENQNPYYVDLSFKGILKDLFVSIFGVLGIYNLIKKIHRKSSINNRIEEDKHTKKDAILHGSILMFTPVFFKSFSGFYPKTFLYYEENILGIKLKKRNYEFLYIPEAQVFHKEDGSTFLKNKSNERIKSFHLIASVIKAMIIKSKLW